MIDANRRSADPNIDTTPPADYLATEPTSGEMLLGRQADLDDGAAVPWWMFAKAALRLHAVTLWVARADMMATRTRRWLVAGVMIAVTNLGAIVVYSVHRIEESAVAQERAAALAAEVKQHRADLIERMVEADAILQRQIDEIKIDLRDLRRAFHRLSGRDPLPNRPPLPDRQPDSTLWINPDTLSSTIAPNGAP